MENEFIALMRNNTWQLVPIPSHGNIIQCKWVSNVNTNRMGLLIDTKLVWSQKGSTKLWVSIILELSAWLSRLQQSVQCFPLLFLFSG